MVRACVLLASMRFSLHHPPPHPSTTLFFRQKSREEMGGRGRHTQKKMGKQNKRDVGRERQRRAPLSSFSTPPEDVFDVRYRPIPLCQLDRPHSLIDTHTPTRYGATPPLPSLSDPFARTLSRRVLDETRGETIEQTHDFLFSLFQSDREKIRKKSVITFTAVGCAIVIN
jgi:hypothetical protein